MEGYINQNVISNLINVKLKEKSKLLIVKVKKVNFKKSIN